MIKGHDQVIEFHYFEELPEDLVYVVLSHMKYAEVTALALTCKHYSKLVNESQHSWRQVAKTYFTNVPVTSLREFRSAYK